MKLDFTAFFPFCGLGAGARGFLDAEVSLLGRTARFRSLGGIDVSEEACQDFELLTGSPALCADVSELEPADLLRFVGPTAPDVVFGSPPCQGFSGLLSVKAAKQEKYQVLNELVPKWFDLVLKAWPDEPPRLILLENVPRIASRGKELLDRVKRQLGQAGYLIDERIHDCGELGGLAQHRRRYLLVARHPRRCPPLLFQPPKLRVRGCGEVLGKLPLPGDPDAGPMHTLPRISWLNWVRLALIPAGGDWRDLPGVLAEGQARREVHKRYEVARWQDAMGTICGNSGSNAASYVADPRLTENPNRFCSKYRVLGWDTPALTVTGATRPGSGSACVADPRWFKGVMGVRGWDDPATTVTGGAAVARGAFSVADPRPPSQWRGHTLGVLAWTDPSGTVTGRTNANNGRFSVADPRVAARPAVGSPASMADFDRLIAAWDGDPKKSPPFVPVIIAADGTWHRPMTTLELASLQGLPVELDRQPLKLAGRAVSRWRERIGNAVPVQTATAIARQMLVALTEASLGCDSLGVEPVWVNPAQPANVEIS
jgi:site-specific DNA-cytosine methylase